MERAATAIPIPIPALAPVERSLDDGVDEGAICGDAVTTTPHEVASAELGELLDDEFVSGGIAKEKDDTQVLELGGPVVDLPVLVETMAPQSIAEGNAIEGADDKGSAGVRGQ